LAIKLIADFLDQQAETQAFVVLEGMKNSDYDMCLGIWMMEWRRCGKRDDPKAKPEGSKCPGILRNFLKKLVILTLTA